MNKSKLHLAFDGNLININLYCHSPPPPFQQIQSFQWTFKKNGTVSYTRYLLLSGSLHSDALCAGTLWTILALLDVILGALSRNILAMAVVNRFTTHF